MNYKKWILATLLAVFSLTLFACGVDKNTTATTDSPTTTLTTVVNATTGVTTTATDIQTTLANAANLVILNNADNMTTDFTLPSEAGIATVTWSSNHTEYITVSEGVIASGDFLVYQATVTRPTESVGDVTVVLTGTFVYGDATYDKDFSIRVRFATDPSRVTTIAQGLELALGTYITWEAMTILGVGTDGFFFTDGTDIMFVYSAAVAATVTAGQVYDIMGGIGLYNSIPEVQNIGTDVAAVVASSAAARTVSPVVSTITEIIADNTGYDATNPMQFHVYTVTGKVYYDDTKGNYSTYIIPTDTNTLDKNDAIRIYYKGNMAAVSAFAGQIVTLDVVLFGFNSGATYLDWYGYFFGTVDDIASEDMNDADKLAMDVSKLESAYEVTSSFALPTLQFATYSNVTISTEISSFLSYTAGAFTVVRPSVDTEGTLSVTLTVNAETETIVMDMTMKAVVVVVSGDDIFISQYIEGGSYNKFIEIYNPLDVAVDLSQYTLELYSNGGTATTATLTLSGTLAPGAVIVIYNNKTVPLIYTGDIVDNNVINFNGDDAVVLKHNGVVVDSIGQVGVDPGDYWGTVELGTKDCTLIRNASVTGGDTNPFDEFDPSNEWTAYAKDSIEGLGSHTVE